MHDVYPLRFMTPVKPLFLLVYVRQTISRTFVVCINKRFGIVHECRQR